MNAPREFPGSVAEAEANRRTHYFRDGRCMDCDCRPGGAWASWPCGVDFNEVGYVDYADGSAEAAWAVNRLAVSAAISALENEAA